MPDLASVLQMILGALVETQRVPAANALDYYEFKRLYGREPRMGELPTQEISPLAYLAGQIAGTNVAGGVPGPRFGSLMDDETSRLLALLKSGPKTKSGVGSLSGIGEAQRPWTEIYDIFSTFGKKVTPKSYPAPTEVTLPDTADPLASFLKSLGGTYMGPGA